MLTCNKRPVLALAAIAGCVAFTIAVLLHSDVIGIWIELGHGARMLVCRHPVWTIIVAVTGIILTVAASWLARSVSRKDGGGIVSLLHVLAPLSFLPLSLYGLLLRRIISRSVAANILFFVPVLLLSLVLFRLVQMCAHQANSQSVPGTRTAVFVMATVTLLYAIAGWYFTMSVGEHSGDEGHYLVQARSLYEDHDLDIRNNIPNVEKYSRSHLHVSPSARNGHWYSWHSFGLSVLLAPFVPAGLAVRHLILGLVSGLTCGAVVLLCRQFRASIAGTLVVVILFSLSCLWGIYSSRALPEVLGAGLLAGLVLAVFMQEHTPWRSLLLGASCCCCLPWVHTRFIPPALLCGGVYGVVALTQKVSWHTKLIRTTAFGVLCIAGYLTYYLAQCAMFDGGMAYPVKSLLLSYPLGIWHSLAGRRGILYALPMFCWLLAGALWVLLRDRSNRTAVMLPLACLLTVLVTSCATKWHTGGACLPGRFLLVVMPLMLAPAARAFDRVSPHARWWLIFLGLVSCAQFVLLMVYLPAFEKAFSDPTGHLPRILPLLYGLLDPLWSPYSHDTHLFAVLLFMGTIVLVTFRNAGRFIGLLIPVAVAGAAVCSHTLKASQPGTPVDCRLTLSNIDARGAYVQMWGAPGSPSTDTGLRCLARYTFDGNAEDTGGKEHHGRAHDVVLAPGRAGQPHTAYQFNGVTSKIEIDGIDLAGKSFSFAVWAKMSGKPDHHEVLLGQGNPSQNRGLHVAFYPTRPFIFAFYADDLDLVEGKSYADSWHFWVVTYDATTGLRKIHRDGRLSALDIAIADYAGTGSFFIGAAPTWGGPNSFKGLIDDVAIYEGAASCGQVARMYKSCR